MSNPNEQTILDLIATFADGWPASLDKTMSYLAEDAYYQMAVPATDPIRGKVAIRAEIQGMIDKYASNRSELKAMASNGPFVFTERLDAALTERGWLQIPLVAVFELNDQHLITAWREYLDIGCVVKQQGSDQVFGLPE